MKLLIRWGWLLWRDSPGYLALIVALSFGSAALLTAFPWLWQVAIDRLGGDPADLRQVAGWMLAVSLGQWLLYVVLQGARSTMNARIQWRARKRVFDHLTELDPSFFRRWRAGDLVTRLSDDAGDKISWFLCSGVFRAFEAVLIAIGCLGAMLWIDWRLALWVCLPLPVLAIAQTVAQEVLARRYLEVQQSISAINDELATTFEGVRVVQACGLAPAARKAFERSALRQQAAEVRVARVQQAVHLQYGFGWQLAMVALLLAGGRSVIGGDLTLGEFVAFEGLVMTLVWPMFDVGNFLSKAMQTQVALTRLDELLDEPVTSTWGRALPDGSGIALVDAGAVTTQGVVLVEGIELACSPGERIALVGEVGSGKSTVIALMAGLRSPSSGEVRIGGAERSTMDRDTVRQTVALVPQDPSILSATVRENLVLGRTIDEPTLAAALEASRLAQDLPSLPDGLETRVGERGLTLSGGQQQRLAIARALAGRPQILLLDDATAALDADTEAAFWEHLAADFPQLAAVVVTHRVATLATSDRVIVLEGGRVVQQGTHEALLHSPGPYRAIYGG